MLERIKREPVLLTTLVSNLIGLGVAFGLDVSAEQIAALMLVVNTVSIIVFGRQNVTPNADVDALLVAVSGPSHTR